MATEHDADDSSTGTDTQPAPNISTEHQNDGDARDPGDTLDRDRAGASDVEGQQDVEDRPSVGTVAPEDYPTDQRAR